MFEHWIGEAKFREGVQLYLKQHAWGNATASDFEAAMSSVAGQNVAPAFNSFLDQPGVPEVSVALKCGAQPSLDVTQKRSLPVGSQAKPQTWQIPVCVAFEADGVGASSMQLAVGSQGRDCIDRRADLSHVDSAQRRRDGLLSGRLRGRSVEEALADRGSHLSVAERVGVLGDVDSLASEGEVSAQVALALVPEFSKDPGLARGASGGQHRRAAAGRECAGQSARERASASFASNSARRRWHWDGRPSRTIATTRVCCAKSWFRSWPASGRRKRVGDQAENAGARMAGDAARASLRRCSSRCCGSRPSSEIASFSIRFEPRPLRSAHHHVREILLEALGSFRSPELARASLDLLLSKDFDLRESFYPLLFGPCLTWIRAMFRSNS